MESNVQGARVRNEDVSVVVVIVERLDGQCS
jgi:hypothetical protein